TAAGGMHRVLASESSRRIDPGEDRRIAAVEHLYRWGGMPELLNLPDAHRHEWLRSYQQTFLERDLTDLVTLRHLHPFRKLQQLVMLRTGQILSYSELARDAQISVDTVRRYLTYLDMSYQVLLLQPYSRNLTSRVIKSPKVYWMDMGLLRQGTGQWGPMTGAMFETMVVSELHKLISTLALDISMSFYRTRSGLEVDVILDTPGGMYGMEIKNRNTVDKKDLTSLIRIAESAKETWRGGMVIYTGQEIRKLNDDYGIWAVPLHRLLT
ncbi:MAG TPA: DUF4143 domain-containing protein, partial [bacterium]|nr:DUF4143 domain-containing protein [bacterium]